MCGQTKAAAPAVAQAVVAPSVNVNVGTAEVVITLNIVAAKALYEIVAASGKLNLGLDIEQVSWDIFNPMYDAGIRHIPLSPEVLHEESHEVPPPYQFKDGDTVVLKVELTDLRAGETVRIKEADGSGFNLESIGGCSSFKRTGWATPDDFELVSAAL